MSYVWPVKGRVSQGFGRPALKVEPTMWLAKDESRCRPTKFAGAVLYEDVHPGIDVVCPVGTPILAPGDGKVTRKIWYRVFWQGRYVNGLLCEFRYEKGETTQKVIRVDHLSKCLPEDTLVKAGKPFAWSGNSGASTGPHTHLEDRHGPSADHPSESNDWFRYDPERSLK